MLGRVAVAITVVACSAKPEATPAPPAGPHDAGPIDGITEIGSLDPNALDRDPRNPRGAAARGKNRQPRPIDVMLKSSPSGAIAAVDGVQIGVTPTYWSGDADGREHEFTFVKSRFAVARYRFVPIQSGVVHARLDPVSEDLPDGGLDSIRPPVFTPEPVAPPPTVLTPDAAPVTPPPAVQPGSGSGSAGSGSGS